ncbi:MAG: hypothetical protein D6820_13880 [Lentisphaerae bacterium]|nr:MAG: hypothetical protein D6820_13880 [Lentisphaerota bacterium]
MLSPCRFSWSCAYNFIEVIWIQYPGCHELFMRKCDGAQPLLLKPSRMIPMPLEVFRLMVRQE